MNEDKTSKNILLLGFVSLLNDISSEIIQPILPLFIASLGGGSLAVGLIGGISDGLPSLLKVMAGYGSDRLGKRKPLVVAGTPSRRWASSSSPWPPAGSRFSCSKPWREAAKACAPPPEMP